MADYPRASTLKRWGLDVRSDLQRIGNNAADYRPITSFTKTTYSSGYGCGKRPRERTREPLKLDSTGTGSRGKPSTLCSTEVYQPVRTTPKVQASEEEFVALTLREALIKQGVLKPAPSTRTQSTPRSSTPAPSRPRTTDAATATRHSPTVTTNKTIVDRCQPQYVARLKQVKINLKLLEKSLNICEKQHLEKLREFECYHRDLRETLERGGEIDAGKRIRDQQITRHTREFVDLYRMQITKPVLSNPPLRPQPLPRTFLHWFNSIHSCLWPYRSDKVAEDLLVKIGLWREHVLNRTILDPDKLHAAFDFGCRAQKTVAELRRQDGNRMKSAFGSTSSVRHSTLSPAGQPIRDPSMRRFRN